jgi:protein subunit release factor A
VSFAFSKSERTFDPVDQINTEDLLIESYVVNNPSSTISDAKTHGVKIVHRPTGVTVIKADFLHAHLNRDAAIKELSQKLMFRNAHQKDNRVR